MKTPAIQTLCFYICLVSLACWVALSACVIWTDLVIFEAESRQMVKFTMVGRLWMTSQVVFIASALLLRLLKSYHENQAPPSRSQ